MIRSWDTTHPQTHTLLHIEDDESDAEKVHRMLIGSDFQIHLCDTLAAGATELRERKFDVVLLDLRLPDSEGAASIAELAKITSAPIIVLTGNGDEERGLEMLQHGAHDFLEKEAFDRKLLQRSLRYAIERAKLLLRAERAERMAAQEREMQGLEQLAKRMT